MKKQLLAITSILLVACLLFTAFPVAAATADGNENTFVDDNMKTQSTNSVGAMIADAVGEEEDRQEENNGINIFSVEVEGNVATAEIETTRDATVVIGIYSEDGSEMYASGKTDVTKDDETVQVNIDIETMPQYFYVKAYIIDTNTLKPLCTVYNCPNYTQEMQEFFAKTTGDFEQDRVLNLDNDATNNFAVYKNDVALIATADEVNNMVSADEDNFVYVIENADESILSLTPGQIFSYNYDDGNAVIVKVKTVTIDGTTATIEGEDIALEDVFEYFKIDTEKDETEYEPEGLSDGLEYVGEEPNSKAGETVGAGEYEGEIKKTHEFRFWDFGPDEEGPFGKLNLTGGFNFTYGFKMKVYIMHDEKYLELKLEVEGNLDFKVTFNATGNAMETLSENDKINVSIGKLTAHLIPGIVGISINPTLVCEVSGTVEIKGKVTTGCTFKASSQTGTTMKYNKPEFSPEIKISATIFIGLDLKPEVSVGLGLFSLDITAQFGFEISAKLEIDPIMIDDSTQHDCDFCLSGEVNFKADLSGKVRFLKILGSLTHQNEIDYVEGDIHKKGLSAKLLDLKIKIADFYYSADYHEFAFTTCPHKRYKLDISVYDFADKPLSNAAVAVAGNSLTTNGSGKAFCYLPNGDYTVTASNNGNTVSNTVKIYAKSNAVILRFNSTGGTTNPYNGGHMVNLGGFNIPVTGDIVAVEAGAYHSAALTKDGTLYMWGYNLWGQIGDGSTVNRTKAIKINSASFLPEHSVKQVSLGYSHSAALTYDGSLYTWGSNSHGQIGDGTTTDVHYPKKIMSNVKMITCNAASTAAVTTDGSLYMWGNNDSGQIGNGTTNNSLSPVRIMDNVKYISLGPGYSAAITTDNSLYTWGSNNKGQLGNGTTNNKNRPEKIMSNIRSVSLSETGQYGVAFDFNDTMYMWGDNNSGVFGDGTRNSCYYPIIRFSNIRYVSTGGSHITTITKDNSLYLWGWNNCGQLGNGGNSDELTPRKKYNNVLSSACGSGFTIVLTLDGKVLTCGRGDYGQLGNGNKSNATVLREIEIWDHSSKDPAPVGAKSDNGVGEGAIKTVTFNGYKPNGVYNFYSMKEKEDGLASDNLLYISQVTANENGSVTITYTGADVCENPIEFLESLEAVDISDLTLESAEYTYNGFEQYYQPVIKNGSCELCEGIDYTVGGVYSATDVGEYTVIINGKGIFTGSRAEIFTIVPDGINDVSVDLVGEFIYNGSEFTPEITVSDKYRNLTIDKDYTVSYQNNISPGSAVVEITGTGNYTGSKVVNFEILPCDIRQNSTVELESIPSYSGEPITPDFTLTVNDLVLEQDTDYTVNYYNNINKGIGIIEIRGKGGYKGRIICWFDITECDIGEFGYCSSVKYQVYSGDEQNPEPTVIVQGRRLVKGVDYTVEYKNNAAVGMATITVTGIGNYSGVLSTSFEIIDEAVGDANLDRYVNVNDVTAIQRHLAELETLDDKNLALADTNGDGTIDISDATHLQMYLAEYDVVLGKQS